MRHQEATTTLAAPLAAVESYVADVTHWPAFLIGLDTVERLGHQRYRFCVRDGADRREVVVAVRRDPARHRVTWRALEGPEYSGCLALTPVDTAHTKVHLELSSHPGTFAAGLAEMILPRKDRAAHDLHELEVALGAG